MTSSSPHQLYSPVSRSRSQFHAIRNLNLNASLAVVVLSTCRLRGDFSCSCVCVSPFGWFFLLFDFMYLARQGYSKGKCCCGASVECTWGVLPAELLTYHDPAMVLNDSRLIRIVASFVSLLQERGTSSVPVSMVQWYLVLFSCCCRCCRCCRCRFCLRHSTLCSEISAAAAGCF